mmetsp:Transcript_56993/g.146935  ORF Transcript_56993/g.146935 Transcript_56993/m.146935 type:complete len:211 (+) Transcript_56993:775-1407(+)
MLQICTVRGAAALRCRQLQLPHPLTLHPHRSLAARRHRRRHRAGRLGGADAGQLASDLCIENLLLVTLPGSIRHLARITTCCWEALAIEAQDHSPCHQIQAQLGRVVVVARQEMKKVRILPVATHGLHHLIKCLAASSHGDLGTHLPGHLCQCLVVALPQQCSLCQVLAVSVGSGPSLVEAQQCSVRFGLRCKHVLHSIVTAFSKFGLIL